MLHHVNQESRLYVLHCGNRFSGLGFGSCDKRSLMIAGWILGFSRLGFDECEQRSLMLAGWILGRRPDARLPNEAEVGTEAHYRRYEKLSNMARGICEADNVRCNILLSPQLTGLEGERVEVVDYKGEKRRFQVGKSTGWMPIHLEVARRGSYGGKRAYGETYHAVKTI